jgi:hypothetical protein
MKLWISGEVHADVIDEYRICRNLIEQKCNKLFEKASYGGGLEKFAFIGIILPDSMVDSYEEVKTFDAVRRVAEFWLRIDFNTFKRSERHVKTRLMCKSLECAVKQLQGLNVNDFNHDAFLGDFNILMTQILENDECISSQ